MISFEHPYIFLLMIPVILIGIYMLKKTKRKVLIASRIAICLLLVAALANPFSYIETTTKDKSPDIVLISDNTDSMNLFKGSVGEELIKSFSETSNARIVTLKGKETRLGDAIVGASNGKDRILLVTDGNNNYGQTLERALEVSKEIGNGVSAVIPDMLANDVSVEISGDKTAIIGNENSYSLIIRQAAVAETTTYTYKISADGKVIKSGSGKMNDKKSGFRESRVPFTHKFSSLGPHSLKAEISTAQDKNTQNNIYTKSLYVIEKPEVIIITNQKNAPLSQIAGNLYNVTIVQDLSAFKNKDEALKRSKTVILDNMYVGNVTETDVKSLKKYVMDGGGLVVVGGVSAYDRPPGKTYLNSSFEKLLPVISKPSDWEGNRDIVLLIDISLSSEVFADDSKYTLIENIKRTATNIVENPYFNDSNIALAIFGNVGEHIKGNFYYMGNPAEKRDLTQEIKRLNPSSTSISMSTDLENGFTEVSDILENRIGEPLVIVLTDGNIVQKKNQYTAILGSMANLEKKDASILFISINSKYSRRADQFTDASTKKSYGQMLMDSYPKGVYITSSNGSALNPDFNSIIGPSEKKPDKDKDKNTYNLRTYNSKHFITSDLNVSGIQITGFNDVTQKGGADRLVITETGQPVLTVWHYGLGRVASLTTDNGLGQSGAGSSGTASAAGGWAGQLYSNPGSKLISATINWAIADPQPETGVVIECPDAYAGTPVKMRLTNYESGVPVIEADGKKIDLVLVEKNVYESEITFNRTGQFNISGYPVYVNYPIEYRDVGVNPDLKRLIEKNGGQIYSASEAQSKYISDIKETTKTKTKTLIHHSLLLCLMALIIFLGEIIYRRVSEIRKLKRRVSNEIMSDK